MGVSYLFSAASRSQAHSALANEWIQNSQDIAAVRSINKTLLTASIFGGHNLVNDYTSTDLALYCLPGLGDPMTDPQFQIADPKLPLILSDGNGKPMGNPGQHWGMPTTQIGSYTYITACVSVPSPAGGARPCLFIQGGIPNFTGINPYVETFRTDPRTKKPFIWRALRILPDCGFQ